MQNALSRRNFAKTVIGAGGVLAASGIAKALAQSAVDKILDKKLGIALVGLGYYSTDVLAPALQETKNVQLRGIVTGTPAKAKAWREKYDIPENNIYNYDTFDQIADNDDIDIIYVVLPNSMHAEYVIRAARAGKHVICEKPMALTVEECDAMIDACAQNNVALSIGYRMQFEPHTQELMRYAKEKVMGAATYVTANAGYYHRDGNHWKAKKEYGGGAIMDMGVYSINAARYSTAEEPVSVMAQQFKTRPQVFKEVEETATFQFEFPSGAVANCMTSFSHRISLLHVVAEKGWVQLNPMQSYRGIKMTTRKGPVEFPQINQQATQMDEVAWCIVNKKPMRVPGKEGRRDIKIVQAIHQSLQTGKKIAL